MAFITYNPGISGSGTQISSSKPAHDADTPIPSYRFISIDGTEIASGSLQVLYSPAVNTSGISKPFSGWLTYTGGGGGARPTTGMIYPRREC